MGHLLEIIFFVSTYVTFPYICLLLHTVCHLYVCRAHTHSFVNLLLKVSDLVFKMDKFHYANWVLRNLNDKTHGGRIFSYFLGRLAVLENFIIYNFYVMLTIKSTLLVFVNHMKCFKTWTQHSIPFVEKICEKFNHVKLLNNNSSYCTIR